MSLTREAMEIETNQQLRLLNRKKEPGGEGTGTGGRTKLTDKGCRSSPSRQPDCGKTGGGKLEPMFRATALGGEAAGKILRASDDQISQGLYL